MLLFVSTSLTINQETMMAFTFLTGLIKAGMIQPITHQVQGKVEKSFEDRSIIRRRWLWWPINWAAIVLVLTLLRHTY